MTGYWCELTVDQPCIIGLPPMVSYEQTRYQVDAFDSGAAVLHDC